MDLIERQAAIDAINNIMPTKEGFYEPSEVLCELMQLPSTNPKIIYCKDCKWKNGHNCTRAVELFIDDNKYCAWAERR